MAVEKKKTAVKRKPVKKVAAKKPVKKTVAKKTTVKKAAPRARKNPVPQSKVSKLKQAVELYENFSGHQAEFYDKVRVRWPDVAVKVGECTGLLYETVRDGKTERYIHKFKKSARPLLIAAHDGEMVAVVGGDYRFTERGIVDN